MRFQKGTEKPFWVTSYDSYNFYGCYNATCRQRHHCPPPNPMLQEFMNLRRFFQWRSEAIYMMPPMTSYRSFKKALINLEHTCIRGIMQCQSSSLHLSYWSALLSACPAIQRLLDSPTIAQLAIAKHFWGIQRKGHHQSRASARKKTHLVDIIYSAHIHGSFMYHSYASTVNTYK